MRLIDADKLRKDILDMPNCYNGFSDTYDKAMILDMIDEQPSIDGMSRWIPITERLPEEGIVVVTVDKDGDYEINAIIDEEEGEWFLGKAIAWMPLPKPYERKEE